MVLLDRSACQEAGEELIKQLRSVIISRSKEGATLDEIIDDYRELTGDPLLESFGSRQNLANYLSRVDGIWYSTEGSDGLILWYCSTPRTKHLVELIQGQKPNVRAVRNHRNYAPVTYSVAVDNNPPVRPPTADPACPKFFKDNVRPPRKPLQNRYKQPNPPKERRWRPYNRSYRPKRPRADELDVRMFGPSFHKHQLMGDDFFLSIAKWELGYSFDRGHSIAMSGLCISGLTLAEAAKRVEVAPFIAPQVLVNVGTVDLLHGRQMIDLIHDFDTLMARFRERNVEPLVTTLAPIANAGGWSPMQDRLRKFNEYIRFSCPNYLDLGRYFQNDDGSVRFECYQPGPRKVTGSIMPHVLWNKLGRNLLLLELGNELANRICESYFWSNV
ncbi:maternal effect protein oskar-like [Anopheles albimanus]|uniref:OSK domain-containing protein n=1 Tax=Anopheles albimanus TaxID=7167 RepID=A0A182F7Q5_ANOAL|nr:maternal effect protein oskar-like [Anopheles albimanus]